MNKRALFDETVELFAKLCGKASGGDLLVGTLSKLGGCMEKSGKIFEAKTLEEFGKELQEFADENKIKNIITGEYLRNLYGLFRYHGIDFAAAVSLIPQLAKFSHEIHKRHPSISREDYIKAVEENFVNNKRFKMLKRLSDF